MKEKKQSFVQDLTVGNVARQLIMFAAPLFLSGLLQTVYNMADMVIVGQYVGKEGLSAVSVGGDVLALLTFVSMGISNAGQILISQYVGAGRNDKVSKMIGTLFTFLLSCAVFITVICLFIQDKIIEWVNMPEEAAGFGKAYIFVCILGLVFIFGYNLVSAVLRGMGDSRHPLLFIAIASLINIVLDLVLIVCFHMGVLGAALATVFGQAVSFLWSLVYLYRRKEAFGFDFRWESFRIDPQVLRPLLTLGVPMILQSAAVTFSKLFVTSWVNTYGVVASAVTGIGNKLQLVTNVFAQALSTAGGSMIAQNIGAKKYKRVSSVVNISFVLDGAVTVVLTAVTVAFPYTVFGIFTNDVQVLNMCISFIPVAIVLYAGCVLRPPMSALINGTGRSRLNLTIALLDGIVVRIFLAYLMGKIWGFGIYGFWMGNALASCVPFLVGMPYYLSGKWKNIRAYN
ncbi:MATE family efflux transporter [Blautia schinkii]|nr:MATE family efflux transporter [Blautia schinkii]